MISACEFDIIEDDHSDGYDCRVRFIVGFWGVCAYVSPESVLWIKVCWAPGLFVRVGGSVPPIVIVNANVSRRYARLVVGYGCQSPWFCGGSRFEDDHGFRGRNVSEQWFNGSC